MESFCLEFRNVPRNGTEAFSAYAALYYKAVPVADNDSPNAFTVGGDLKLFIETGEVLDKSIDESTFKARQAPTATERQAKLIENLEAMVAFYVNLKAKGFSGQEMRTSDGNNENLTKTPSEPETSAIYEDLLSLEIIHDLIGQYRIVLNAIERYVPGIDSTTAGISDPPV